MSRASDILRAFNEVGRNPDPNPKEHEFAVNNLIPEKYRIYNELRAKYGDPIGSGMGRVVFDSMRGFVIKLGYDNHGDEQNLREAEISKHHKAKSGTDSKFAECRLVYVRRIPILIMQRVAKVSKDKLPDWSKGFDTQQVGKRGDKFKAYDYGDWVGREGRFRPDPENDQGDDYE